MSRVLRIAMWSGPRNVSTALMRAFGSRTDTVVCDEPLYAFYLKTTRLPHPGADEVLAHHESDGRRAVDGLFAPLPPGKSIFFQKHMAHHLLPEITGTWLDDLTHCFLIRDPREMLLSLDRILDRIRIEDTGLPQQLEIFERARDRLGSPPPVVDAFDLLSDPRRVLSELCARVGVAFDESMLSWLPGIRETDGIWSRHWYGNVEKSTGFEQPVPRDGVLAERLEGVLGACTPIYQSLYRHRIGIGRRQSESRNEADPEGH